MNCKVCGKELDKDAKFCSNCGCRVATEAVEEPSFDSTGFLGEPEKEKVVSTFHGYAQPEENFEEKLAATKNISFDWDLDDFNSTKDIENIDFNWNDVLEKDSKKNDSERDSLFTEEDIHRGEPVNFDWALGTTTRIEKEKLEDLENAETYNLEELIPSEPAEEKVEDEEAEVVEEPPKKNIDKFYTFNKKNEEFQALLDEEYERLRQRIKEENEAENVIRDKEEKLEKARNQWENSKLEPVADDADRMANIEKADSIPSVEDVDDIVSVGNAEAEVAIEKAKADSAPEAAQEPKAAKEPKAIEQESTPMQEKTAKAKTQELEPVASNDIHADTSKDNKEEKQLEKKAKEPVKKQVEKQAEKKVEKPAKKTSVNHLDGSFAQAKEGIVAIVQPIGTTLVDLCKGEVSEHPTEVEPPKRRIKYSDIFELDEEPEKPKKPEKSKKKEKAPKEKEVSNKEEQSSKNKNLVLNIIIVILLIIMIVSGILAFAPNSVPGQFIQGNIDKVKALFIKEEPAPNPVDQKTPMEMVIESEAGRNKNIGKVEEGLDMGFSYTDDYGIDGLLDSSAFVDSVWHTDDDGNTVNYGNAIVGNVISYFSSMVEHMNKGSSDILSFVDESSDLYEELEDQEKSSENYGISLLKIGEIRTIDNNYYVMTSVTEKIGDEDPVEKRKVIQLVSSDKQMKVTAVTDI